MGDELSKEIVDALPDAPRDLSLRTRELGDMKRQALGKIDAIKSQVAEFGGETKSLVDQMSEASKKLGGIEGDANWIIALRQTGLPEDRITLALDAKQELDGDLREDKLDHETSK